MIRRRSIVVLAAMGVAALAASVALLVASSSLQLGLNAYYFSGDAGGPTPAMMKLMYRDSALANALGNLVAPLVLGGLLAAVAALALTAYRAGLQLRSPEPAR